jgi:DNA replication and repair protein RecF
MYLKRIQLTNFKNYKEVEMEFNRNVNGIVGVNGTGKTNLLDAIHYLTFCKSYFNAQDSYAVNFEADFFALHGEFVTYDAGQNSKISCTYKTSGRKVMKANAKEYERFSDHIGLYPLVMVSPYDSDIINDGSDIRRKFFDMIIVQFDKEYLHQLISYQKLLRQRNNLLKQFWEQRRCDESLLNLYDEQLQPFAEFIPEKRKQFINNILPVFQAHYDLLSNSREQVSITYDSSLHKIPFRQGIAQMINADQKSGFTNFGTHKDDFIFYIGDQPIKRYGSQGQQKSFALALKLAQYDYIYERKKLKPILLLDDIFDKLDKQRTARLLELVGQEHFGQVFISDTDEVRVTHILTEYCIEHKITKVDMFV